MASKLSNKNYIAIADWQMELGLNPRNTLLYCLIYGFSQDQESSFYGSLNYIAEWLDLDKKQSANILRNLKDLVEQGLVTKEDEKIKGYQKVCKYRTIINKGPVIENPDIEYIIIQPWMIKKLKLSGKELFLYSLIYGHSRGEGNICYFSYKYFSKWLQCRGDHVQRYIKKLLDKKLIKEFNNGYIALSTQNDSTLTDKTQNDSTSKKVTNFENNSTQNDSNLTKNESTYSTYKPKMIDNNLTNNLNNNLNKELDLSSPIFDSPKRRKEYKLILKQLNSLNCTRKSMIKLWNKIALNGFKDPGGKDIENMAAYMIHILSKNPYINNKKTQNMAKMPDYNNIPNNIDPTLLEEAKKAIQRRAEEAKNKQEEYISYENGGLI